jgi:ABC-type transporter Mla subunit MlaD
MAEYRRSEIVSGVFILASVLVFALFAFKVVGIPIPLFEESGVVCEAYFHGVETLDRAAKVTIGGHRIGNVIEIRPVERALTADDVSAETRRTGALPAGWAAGRERHLIRVRFRITDGNVRIGDEASVAVAQEGFIGPFFLDVDPGTWSTTARPAFIVEKKGTIVPFRTRQLDSFKDFVPLVRPILQDVEAIVGRIQHGLIDPLLDGQEAHLRNLIPELERGVQDARAGINDVRRLLDPDAENSVARNLNAVLTNADQSLTAIRRRLLDEVLPAITAAIADGRKAVATADATIADVRKTIQDADPKLRKVLDDLAAESGRLEERVDDLQTRLGKVLDDADHLLALRQAEVAEVVRSLLKTAWEIEMAARKVRANPAVLIFGSEEQRLEAEPRDDTGLRNRARVKPYEQRDESPTKKD